MKNFKIFSKLKKAISLAIPTLIVFTLAQAGSLSPLAAPAATSYTMSDIFTRLTTNTSATAGNHSFNATTTPTATFQTLTDIYNAIPTIYATDLLATSTYLGVTGTIAVKSGDADASSAATSTNKLMLTPAVGYYNGSTATVSTTSTAFTASNIKLGTYLLGIVGTLYGDTDATKVLTTASAPGSISVIAGNTAVSSSSPQGTSIVLAVPNGYYSGADSVTVSTSSSNFISANIKSGITLFGVAGDTNVVDTSSGTAVTGDIANNKIAFSAGSQITGSMFTNQKLQTRDDWVNSEGTTGEYTGEEATWTTVSGSPFAGYSSINYAGSGGDLDLYSGTVKQDTRTGLWWSDISAVGASASTISNVFDNATDGTRPTGGNAIGFCDALNTASFGGYADWYLPTQKQLMQAYVDGSANNLPNPGNYFWSSTELYNSTAYAWNVYLTNGYTSSLTKVTAYYVRCVRS